MNSEENGEFMNEEYKIMKENEYDNSNENT